MKKEITNNETVKNLEFKGLLDESQKLAKVNDLWYFVKSKRKSLDSWKWSLIRGRYKGESNSPLPFVGDISCIIKQYQSI